MQESRRDVSGSTRTIEGTGTVTTVMYDNKPLVAFREQDALGCEFKAWIPQGEGVSGESLNEGKAETYQGTEFWNLLIERINEVAGIDLRLDHSDFGGGTDRGRGYKA